MKASVETFVDGYPRLSTARSPGRPERFQYLEGQARERTSVRWLWEAGITTLPWI